MIGFIYESLNVLVLYDISSLGTDTSQDLIACSHLHRVMSYVWEPETFESFDLFPFPSLPQFTSPRVFELFLGSVYYSLTHTLILTQTELMFCKATIALHIKAQKQTGLQ